MERELLTSLAVLMLVSSAAFADEADSLTALKQVVATATSYPEAKLTVEEGPMFGSGEARDPRLIANAIFRSADNSFYQLQVLIGKPGRILPAEMRAEFDAALAAPLRPDGKKPRLRRVQFPEGAVLYHSGMMGPGGGGASFFVIFPGRDAEVALNWTIPFQDPVDIEKAPAEYQKLFSGASPEEDWLRLAYSLAGDSLNVVTDKERETPNAPNRRATDPPGGSTVPIKPSEGGAVPVQIAPVKSSGCPHLWLWLAGGGILIVLFVIALKQRKRIH